MMIVLILQLVKAKLLLVLYIFFYTKENTGNYGHTNQILP